MRGTVNAKTHRRILRNMPFDAEVKFALVYHRLVVLGLHGHGTHNKLGFPAVDLAYQTLHRYAGSFAAPDKAAFKVYIGPGVLCIGQCLMAA